MLVIEVKLSLCWDVSEHCRHYAGDGDKAELVSGLMYLLPELHKQWRCITESAQINTALV